MYDETLRMLLRKTDCYSKLLVRMLSQLGYWGRDSQKRIEISIRELNIDEVMILLGVFRDIIWNFRITIEKKGKVYDVKITPTT